MKRSFLIIVVLLVFASQITSAYERSMLNLKTPTELEKGEMEFTVRHRFSGKINEKPFDNFLGMDVGGTNIGIGFRYIVWSKLELNVLRTRGTFQYENEYTLGASFAHSFSVLRTQMGLQFFSSGERKSNLFGQLDLRSEPILERVIPVVNIGYDGHNRRVGLGFGVLIAFDELTFSSFEGLSLIGEYFPTANEDNLNSFALGIKLKTYGAHQFALLISNGQAISTRRLMLGTKINDLRLGFNIQRLF